jgi:hypothetical protein
MDSPARTFLHYLWGNAAEIRGNKPGSRARGLDFAAGFGMKISWEELFSQGDLCHRISHESIWDKKEVLFGLELGIRSHQNPY